MSLEDNDTQHIDSELVSGLEAVRELLGEEITPEPLTVTPALAAYWKSAGHIAISTEHN